MKTVIIHWTEVRKIELPDNSPKELPKIIEYLEKKLRSELSKMVHIRCPQCKRYHGNNCAEFIKTHGECFYCSWKFNVLDYFATKKDTHSLEIADIE